MAKDLNIHIKVKDTEEARRLLEGFSQDVNKVGGSVKDMGSKAGEATNTLGEKLTGVGGILQTLTTKVGAFIAAWLGLKGVEKVISVLMEKLARIAQYQKEIYDNSLNLAQLGQSLESQTGTQGKQLDWAKQAAKLQESGSLASPEIARQMMASMDRAFSGMGGIKNPKVMELANKLAPFIGTHQLEGEAVGKLFDLAESAHIAPTEKGYKDYFAKLQAGYKASGSTNFGQFITNLQSGTVGYLSQGGSLEQAISGFATAQSITKSETSAAGLMEEVSRISEGGHEESRKAIERSEGVKWSNLTMDQRMAALLSHVNKIPQSQRAQVLTKEGFRAGVASDLSKMATPEAIGTLINTSNQVRTASAGSIEEETTAYKNSLLGKKREGEAQRSGKLLDTAPKLAGWQERFKKANADFEVLVATGKDQPLIADEVEPYLMAYGDIIKDIDEMERDPNITGDQRRRAELLRAKIIAFSKKAAVAAPLPIYNVSKHGAVKGQEFQTELESLQKPQPIIINNHYDSRIQYTIGRDSEAQPRLGPEDIR